MQTTMTIDELAKHMHRDRNKLTDVMKRYERRFRQGAEVEILDTRLENSAVKRKVVFTDRGIVMMLKLVDLDEDREQGPFTVLASCLEGRGPE